MTASRSPGVPRWEGAGPRYRRGDVVLVPFPFADRLAEKQRPAVVVSTPAYQAAGGDLIIVQLTSRTDAPPRPGDHRLASWQEAGLPLPTLARARLATLHRGRIRRRLGTLASADLAAVERGLRVVLGLDSA
ncbi:MAG: type II toxin-antitoxin system PemK/MazF family toxin [Chloroflexi bacterium]|nr:type II toxin-antitoxin system PemK/MazF family toxin [Chloroflexota bacterium]